MKISKYIFILLTLSLLVISGCSKQEPAPVYQPPVEQEKLIISLEKTQESGVTNKYQIYSTGKYITSLINKNKEETKNENTLLEADLNYLKSLVDSDEFNSIPPYMEGAGENCPIILLRVYLNKEITKRSESCANTPEAFNKIVLEIEKLK
ncbi:MAG: hypothetical protein AABW58_01940 [Nanoarchaeota archaeon]